jgi:riboflavin biosynthesis pyrimidine reductase
MLSLGNQWTQRHYGGDFLMSGPHDGLPAVSLVFVRSREGNTVAQSQADLGGGDTDLHLIYEGLSRVSADAVLAGTRTASGRAFYSVWHPELVALRIDLGLPRHPAQIVVSLDGNLDERALLFNVASVPVYVIAGPRCRERWASKLERPGVTIIPTETADLTKALRELHSLGIQRISVAGGRCTASSLIDAGLVQDLYLTTTLRSAGKPGTPFYAGTRRLLLDSILRKRLVAGRGEPSVLFEHFKVRTPE